MPRGGFRPGAGRKPAGASAKGQPISIRLPDDLLAELGRRAAETGASRSVLVERLVRQALAIGP
ncbi:MAG: ribbon-helix-helix protein, CopG family [Cyanobacteria bacterium REEB65]|nr:ribbon-helix-helix protein, CopG family [Cyanobacteria bacterium REEB65]